jgi:hypothetical protein
MSKRIIYELRWSKANDQWMLSRRGEVPFKYMGWLNKKASIASAATIARTHHEENGKLTQLVVRNKNGRIAFERTYGKDPRRRKG